jgi:hypothetical protein
MDRIYHSGSDGMLAIHIFDLFPDYDKEIIEDKLRNLAAMNFIRLSFDGNYAITHVLYIPESKRRI